ncbi:MAG: DUF1848 family protein [Desulfobacterales bacterium]|jgi:hypothetical protein|nr:DUF1848 family protein [Desulfobacterales bacterium]
MKTPPKIVLSASRRTDIPAFYMDWFMAGITAGVFEVKNPYNGRTRQVPATTDTVHTIVFWSKNFGPFIQGGYERTLKQMGFHLFFNFTINSESTALEPHVPLLSTRLQQLSALTQTNPAEAISWRFDPICRYQTGSGAPTDNLKDFDRIAEHANSCGLTRCITSFMDLYPKIKRRTARNSDIRFTTFSIAEQTERILAMHQKLNAMSIQLQTCCENDLIQSLPSTSGITNGACIPNDLLMQLFGGRLSIKKDTGQRTTFGCNCKVSVDIGSYDLHPCFHNCLFCYANPAPPPEKTALRSSPAEGCAK